MVKKLSGININKDLSEGVIDLNDESKLEDSLIAPIDNKTEEKTEEKIETKTEDKKTTLEKLTEVIEEELPTVESVTGSKPEDKEESDKFKPLHNPLPLPKSKSSSKKEDDFDIEVSESDDFDI